MAACFSRGPERTRTAYAYDRRVRVKRPSSIWIRSADRRGLDAGGPSRRRCRGSEPVLSGEHRLFIHRMDPITVQTAAEPLARTVRIQIITPPGALTRDAQKQS